MRPILFIALLSFCFTACAQKETFDVINYTSPKNWKKEQLAHGLQLAIRDEKKRTYAVIIIFKSVESAAEAKQNFDNLWDSLVKTSVTVNGGAQMQPPAAEAGWDVLTGFAPYTNGEEKGVVMQVTATGYNKVANLILLTNTDVYQTAIDDFMKSLSLKKLAITNTKSAITPTIKTETITQPMAAKGFSFTTTNFDDGWTSVAKEDWVEVTKADIKVLIHYPNKSADAYNSVVLDGLKNAWDVLVAPRYSSANNFEFKPITGWQSIEFAEADMVEKNTGKTVHVVLFKMGYSNGNGRYLEFITRDKNLFEQEYGAYHQTTSGWEKMEKMADYNKFAVAAIDLKGKWTTDFTGMIQYVNAYTGADAGANTHASNENFEFGAGYIYKWDLAVASGFVGNIKFQNVQSTGKFSVPNNWQVSFSDIEGKPKTYNVHFTCIKGARVLWIGDTRFGKKE